MNIFKLYAESNEEPQMHERADGTKAWYTNSELHRVDGPAIENANGTKMWYMNDKLHRVDGAAIEWANGSKEWYMNGKEYKDVSEWAKAALEYENKLVTQDAIDAKIIEVMQADLFK